MSVGWFFNVRTRKKKGVYAYVICKCTDPLWFTQGKAKFLNFPWVVFNMCNPVSTTGLGKIIACFSNFIGHPSVLKVGTQIKSFWIILITSKLIILQQLFYPMASKASGGQQDNITNVFILRLCRVWDSPLGLRRKSLLPLGNSVLLERLLMERDHGSSPAPLCTAISVSLVDRAEYSHFSTCHHTSICSDITGQKKLYSIYW